MDKYVYPEINILKNKLGIKTQKELTDAEKILELGREAQLKNKIDNIKRTFDFGHLKRIHGYLFQDIYDWAGKVRDVDMAKGSALFCRTIFIDSYASEIFEKIVKDNYFIGKNMEELVLKLSETLLNLNALHPFREGNGRAQREFIRELAEERGYKLSFDHFTQEEMIELSNLALQPKMLADKLIIGMSEIYKKI
jgi:cell filamentation protein